MSNTGSPKQMTATCRECGYVHRGGCVMPWFKIVDGRSVAKDTVSFLCVRGCEDVTDHNVEIVERWPEVV